MSAYKDAQANNDISRNVKQYRDLDLFFTKKSVNKDVNILTNIGAVKRSVRNLILLNFYEKPFHPEIGCGIRGLLFEPAGPLTSIAISQAATDVLANYEPRANVLGIDVKPDLDRNAYDMTVNFTVINQPAELVQVDVLLEVLR